MNHVWPLPPRSLHSGTQIGVELSKGNEGGEMEDGLRWELTSHWIPVWKPGS